LDGVLQGLLDAFRKHQELGHLKDTELFETFATFCLVSRFHEAHFKPDPLRTGGSADQGIDGFAIIINGEICNDPTEVADAMNLAAEHRVQMVVVQAKTTPEFESKVFTELADSIEHIVTAPVLRNGCSVRIQHVRRCVQALYADERRIAKHKPSLYVWYVTPGRPPSRRIEPKRLEAEQRLSAHSGWFRSVEVGTVSGAALKILYKRATEALSATLTIPKQRRGELPTTPGVRWGIFGFVSAKELVENLLRDRSDTLRTILFDDNVRDFQGYSPESSVNAHIRVTLEDPEERQRFAILNNGITIVARRVELVKSDKVVVIDPRIVNGCQTSNALFDSYNNLNENIQVPVRIFESDNEHVVESIVVATNRQTAINTDDLEVRGILHREIEQYFAARPPARRLYYERRPGQYRQRDILQTRVVTRLDVARAYAAVFRGQSWQVLRIANLHEAKGKELFDPNNDPILYYIAASMHYQFDWLFRNRPLKFNEFRAARYVMMRALSVRLIGPGGLPVGRVDRKVKCNALVETLWAGGGPELLVDQVVPAMRAAVDAFKIMSNDRPLADAARSQEFTERVLALVSRP
jgi:hypothetical protein